VPHKLISPSGEYLAIEPALKRLRLAFNIVIADPEEGADHVAEMIEALLRIQDTSPEAKRHAEEFSRVQSASVYVWVHDAEEEEPLGFVLIPNKPPFISYRGKHEQAMLPLVQRVAQALGYSVKDL
jgi:hypothetical protein